MKFNTADNADERRLTPRKFTRGAALLAVAVFFGWFATYNTEAQFFGGRTGSAAVPAVMTYVIGTNLTTSATSTNFVLPPATNATSTVIDCYNNRNLSISLSAAGSGAVSLGFTRSQDGTHWDTTNFFLLSFTATAGNGSTFSTNVDLGAFEYVCPMMWTNAATVSNVFCTYAIKPGF